MQGRILETGGSGTPGLILGSDGRRYPFAAGHWRGETAAVGGTAVDFIERGGEATDVYPLPATGGQPAATPFDSLGPTSSDSSVLLGWIGIACLVLGFVIPILPWMAAFVLGLVGADSGKRNGNSTGVVVSRIAWIGALVLMLAGVLALVVGFSMLMPLLSEMAKQMPDFQVTPVPRA